MNSISPMPLLRLQRTALIAGVVALVVSALLVWWAPAGLAGAYRLAVFLCLALALGSLMFQLIHRLTGGQWGPALQPFLTAGVTLLPWTWLFVLPLLFVPAHHRTEPHDWYESQIMTLVRALIYGGFFLLLGLALAREHRRRLAGDHVTLRWVAPAGLITLVFLLHLLAEDWLVVLEPGWHSTAFPAVWMVGQALAGFAFALACATLGGADATRPGPAHRPLGLDWGNLLLAGTMFFTYVAFAQFLIIWSGNLPREISWYLHRSEGGWLWVILALAIFHFALPFAFLLSRRFKTFPAGLAGIAVVLLAAQFVYLAWTILPAFAPLDLRALALVFTVGTAALGFFANRYLALARRYREGSAP